MNVEIRDHDIRIRTDKETAQELGARYIKENLYQLPKTIHAVEDLMKRSNNIELGPLYAKMSMTRQKLLYLKKQADISVPFPKLRPYQRTDLAFLGQLPHAAIFNEQRTGKTPTLISLLKMRDYKKCILVV